MGVMRRKEKGMDVWVDSFVTDLIQQLEGKVKAATVNDRALFYCAARMLTAYNELFAMKWEDVVLAEERIKEREAIA